MRAVLKLRLMKLRDDIKLIGLMTAMTLVMIAVFSSINYSREITIFGLIDEDQSTASQLVYESLSKKEGYKIIKYNLEDAKEAVKESDVYGAYYIKEGFEADLVNNKVTIEKLIVAENMSNMQMDNLIQGVISEVNTDEKIISMLHMIVPNETVKTYARDAFEEHRTFKFPVEVKSITLTEESTYSSVKHSVIGFSLFFAMFTIIFGISDILMDKEYHTWDRLLMSPISKFSILGGNLIMTFALGFIQVSSMFLVSKYLFKVDWAGNILHLLIILAAFVFCVTALGMFLSNFVNTMGQLSAISPVIITGTAMLGGCFWPLEIVSSKLLLMLSNITPQKWAIYSIEKVMIHGAGFEEVLFSVLVLVGMGIVYMAAGTYLLEKKSA